MYAKVATPSFRNLETLLYFVTFTQRQRAKGQTFIFKTYTTMKIAVLFTVAIIMMAASIEADADLQKTVCFKINHLIT